LEEAEEQVPDFRRGGCRGEQKTENQAHDRVPDTRKYSEVV